MLKNLIFGLVFCAIFAFSWVHVHSQQPSPKEIELANLIVGADTSLDLNDLQNAADYLSQANQVILQNPGINSNLQGHFHKVGGKMHMKNSLGQALGHFDAALLQFAGNAAEQARVSLFIGIAYYYANDFGTAQIYFNTAKEYFIQSEDKANLAHVLNNLGIVAFELGNQMAAIEFCQQALSINTEVNAALNASRNRLNLDYFSNPLSSSGGENINGLINNHLGGGGGNSGSGTTITTSGSGTVIIRGNGRANN